MDPPLKKERLWTFLITQNLFFIFFEKNVFFKTVFLGKSGHSKWIESPFERYKTLVNFHHPKFFLSLFLEKTYDNVSRQIKSFWVEWTPLWKTKTFFRTVFLGKSSHSESIGPPFDKRKIWNISHHPKFFQV